MSAAQAFAMEAVVLFGSLSVGAWQFLKHPRPSPIAAGLLALGAALAVGIVSTALVHALSLHRASAPWVVVVIPLVVYLGVLVYARSQRSVALSGLLLVGAVGLLGLWFFGAGASLLTACAFGNCL